MTIDTVGITKYYANQMQIAKEPHEIVGWGSQESQELRFKIICNLILAQTDKLKIDLGDFGCGDAALLFFAGTGMRGRLGTYMGVENYAPFMNMAMLRLRNRFDTVSPLLVNEADFWVASGTFNVKGATHVPVWSNWVEEMLTRMMGLSRIGICVNFLYGDKCDSFDKDLYYTSMEYWRKKFGQYVTTFVVHPNLYEFTMSVVRS